MGPMDDQDMQDAERQYPEWDFHQVLGGYFAVPKGTPVIKGMFVASVTDKLREREREGR